MATIVKRVYFNPLRQSGHTPDSVYVQDELAAVWRQYEYIKKREMDAGRVINNPGGLMWKLLRNATNKILDNYWELAEARPKHEVPPCEPDVFAGLVRNTDG